MMHRREFAKRAGLVMGSAWVAGSSQGGATQPGIGMRRNIADLAPGGPEVTTLKKAVSELKRRSRLNAEDPVGWMGQARIHSYACPHGNWFFLPWHRAYLYYFERICRAVSGDPNFMLPYWDWTTHRSLPPVFWGQGNPLDHTEGDSDFLGFRGRRIKADQPMANSDEFVSQEIIDDTVLGVADFSTAMGGDAAPKPRPEDTVARAGGNLEGTPHNGVHGAISGDMGGMWSPLDPIFWLHHANVDRLWALWTDKYPTAFPNVQNFLDFRMGDFFDEKGKPAGMTVRETLSTVALGYQYPGQQLGVVARPQVIAAVPANLRVQARVEAAASRTHPLQVPLTPPEPMRERLAAVAQRRAPEHGAAIVRLKISGVEKQLPPQGFARVFLNCDYLGPGTQPSDPHFVASFSFLRHGEQRNQDNHPSHAAVGPSGFYLNATQTIKELVAGKLFDPSKLRVGIITRLREGAAAPEQDERLVLRPSQVEVALIEVASGTA